MEMEIWKPVVGYEGLYEVSSLGRVKSLPKVQEGLFGLDRRKVSEERIIRGAKNRHGYRKVSLRRDGRTYQVSVHRLVATAFLPNIANYPCVNHKDENPSNNRAENLEWCTYKYNVNYGKCQEKIKESKNRNHSDLVGLIKKIGRGYSNSPKNVAILGEDGHILRVFFSVHEAADVLGLQRSSVRSVCQGRLRQTGGYKFKFV